MNNNIIELARLKINCDTCGYQEDTVGEKMKDFVNKECPKCGANLLTEQDYNFYLVLNEAFAFTNAVFEGVEKASTPETYTVKCAGNEVTITRNDQ